MLRSLLRRADDTQRTELLLFGYVNKQNNLYKNLAFIPADIIKVIAVFYEIGTAFPTYFTCSGYLDARNKTNRPWKRRYFAINNNFLLCAKTSDAQTLQGMYSLEGSYIKSPAKVNDKMIFKLIIRKHQFFFRAPSPKQCIIWKEHIIKASKLKIKDIYRFLYTLGTSESQMQKVVAGQHRASNEECAIKIVDKRSCDKKMLKTEIKIWKKLDNPYIVQIYDVFENKKYLYIVMEMCVGGELFEKIAGLNENQYIEHDWCSTIHQIARGVQYMHEVGIVCRDLKPKNILCVDCDSIKKIKIAEFGISKMVKTSSNDVSTVSIYTAPEALRGKGYDYSVDYWSIGVIMYVLLCGYPPFRGESEQEISQSILNDEVEFDLEDWAHVPQKTRDLVAGLLHKDPTKRSTINDLLHLDFKLLPKKVSFKKARTNFMWTIGKKYRIPRYDWRDDWRKIYVQTVM